MMTEEIIATASKYILGLLTLGGGAAAVAWAIMNAWGKGWLDNHFNRRLELFKHEQTKEIERIKAELNTTLDRAQRLHQWEFEALPQVWSSYVDAFEYAKAINDLRANTPLIKGLSEKNAIEIMQKAGLSEFQIQDVIDSSDRQKSFERKYNLQLINVMHKKMFDYLLLLRTKSIFMDPSITSLFDTANELIRDTIDEFKDNMRRSVHTQVTCSERLNSEGEDISREIERRIVENLSAAPV